MSIHLQHDPPNRHPEVPDEWFSPREQKKTEAHAIKDPLFPIGQIHGGG